jgi:chromosome segregation ATPase
LKQLEANLAAVEGQIASLKSQLANIDAEIKRLLKEIAKLQSDTDDDRDRDRDRQLADIESQLQKALDQLQSIQTSITDINGSPVSPDQRAADAKRAAEALARTKSIREGIAIGRTSKGTKPAPVGSIRLGG